MSLNFKYIPLTFLTDESEIKKQICNTIILRYFFDKNNTTVKLNDLIEGTQYGYNASALESGNNKFLRISDITNGKVDWETVPFCNCDDEETYLLYPDDILIARTGGTTGKSFLISSPPEHSIYAGYLIRIRANSETKPEFLKLFLDSYAYWSQIVSMNEDEFRPSVNANKLKQLLLPKCEPSEQEIAIKISLGEVISGYEDLSIQIDKAINEYENCKRIQQHCLIQKSNTEFLKQSILQEAIQGKLTEEWRKQNPDVEPASELLKRIKAEKAQLIKDKKIRKEKPLPPITEDEKPLELPENWVWCRFQDICNFNIGKTPASKQADYWSKGIYNWLSISDMNHLGYIERTTKKITQKAVDEVFSTHEIVQPNTLLMSFKLTVGKVSINKIPLYHNEAIISIFPYQGILQEFLFKLITPITELSISKKVLMGQTFNSKSLATMLIPLPPEAEQKSIVGQLSAHLNKVDALESEITQSEQHAQMLMQAVLKEAFESKKEVYAE